jgi:class 3 adenylate cyclase/tetratricopeptide (TPR) repeat protein
MQCPQCKAENPPQAKYCMECAAPLDRKCSACGAELPAKAKFCFECAHPVGQAALTPVAPPGPAAYTPQHLAERIISSRGALEGERKQVTVLFADLKGSMELLADRDPEEARAILDPVLERMMEAVHRYEGTVNQVMGDGIMALFGAPIAHEDHAVRACYAALRMQAAVRQYAEEVRRAEGITPQIRVGLNSGEVVVRSISSDLRMDYTAVGQTTHLAARMEQVATPGSVLLAPDTLQLAEGYVQVKALGPMSVKGLSEAVEVYELLGAGTARSRLQAAAARGLTKFVGRDAELETLRRTLEQAGSGHGQVVALVGEPGVGKSRLVWEFRRSHRTQGWLVLESGSVSYGKATSYLPVIDLLKSYCGIEDRDDARRIREKLTGKLLTLDPALQPTLPALLTLLDVPVEDAQWDALDPPQRRHRTLDACKRLLLRESQEQPLLLIFEDLHWTDPETQALLDGLVDSLPTGRVLLLVNYRPEYEHAWHRKTYYQQLRLDPLPATSAEELLDALMGNDGSLAPLKHLLTARTEGNPFFLEESVRSLVEAGALVGERGRYRLEKLVESTQVPTTVQAVLGARIDRLAPEQKRLLQCAAVIGKDVPFALLQAIAELRAEWLRQVLGDLQAAEFLYETNLFPDLEYTFKHALTYEVAYSSVLQDRRRALHARIMEGIETLYSDRLAEHVERLAHHAARSENWAKAATYLQQAGAKAAARSSHSEAVAHFEQALDALRRLPAERAVQEAAIGLRLDLRRSYLTLGQLERVYEHLCEAEALALALSDQHRLAWVWCFMTNYLSSTGQLQQAVDVGQRALRSAADLEDFALGVLTRHFLGQANYDLGAYEDAIALETANVAALPGALALQRFGMAALPAVGARVWLAFSLVECGEFQEALAWGNEALDIAASAEDFFGLVGACVAGGRAYLIEGDCHGAIPLLERGMAICEQWHLRGQVPQVASVLGSAYALVGRPEDAVALLEQSVNQHSGARGPVSQSLWRTMLGEVYLLVGRHHDAAAQATKALHLAVQYRQRGWEARALSLLGEITAHADPPDAPQAETHYRQALILAEELGMRPLAAHCHLGLGTLYQRVGRDEEARAELETAAEMYRAMEMTVWLKKAESALAQVAH